MAPLRVLVGTLSDCRLKDARSGSRVDPFAHKRNDIRQFQADGCRRRAGAILRRRNRAANQAAVKALATLLYAMGNMSFCGIARLLNVSDVAVLKWIPRR